MEQSRLASPRLICEDATNARSRQQRCSRCDNFEDVHTREKATSKEHGHGREIRIRNEK